QGWEDYRGDGWAKALHPDDRKRVREDWARALAERGPYENEARLWHAASGSYRYCIARAVPLLDGAGSTREWIGTLSDGADRKHAEAEAAARAREHEAIARLGETALAGSGLQALMDEAVGHVARTLGTDLCAIQELLPDGAGLLLKAGVGWKPGLVGQATFP